MSCPMRPTRAITRELFREHSLKNGIVKELVDGKEAEKGYYVDGSYEDVRQ